MTVWPKSNPFNATTPSYGPDFLLYLGCIPQTADATYKGGQLHRGYGSSSSPSATVAGENPSGDFDSSAGFIARRFFQDDVLVEMSSRKVAVGTPTPLHHRPGHAIGARIQGGTLSGSGTVYVRHENVTGYVLRVEFQAGTLDWKLVLTRYNSGTPIVVAESARFNPPTQGAFFEDFDLSLQLVNDGSGDVAYVAKLDNLAPSSESVSIGGSLTIGGGLVHEIPAQRVPPGQQAGTSIVLTGTDAAVNKVTTAGRSGFWLDRERLEANGAATVSAASFFRITSDPLGTPVVEWEDTFVRSSLALCRNVTDIFATTGDSLQCEFHGDLFGADQANILQRNAGSYLDVAQTESMGSAASLDGLGAKLVLQDPGSTWPAPAPGISAKWTVLVWANITDHRDGNGLWDQYDTGGDNGFAFGLITAPDIGGKEAWRFEVTLGDGSAAQVYTSNAFVSEDIHKGKTWAYAVSYLANSNPGSGEGRLRCYVARQGQAKLIQEITVPSSVRPTWPDGFGSILGERRDKTGVAADRYLEGTIDEALVTFFELTEAQLGIVANPWYLDPSTWQQAGVPAIQSGWDMDTWTGSPERTYRTLGGSPSTGELRVTGGALSISPGLLPVRPVDRIKCLHMRVPEDFVEQRASVRAKIPDNCRARVFVRGGAINADNYSAYALDVSPGTPAFVQLTRLVALNVGGSIATLETPLARQNLASGAIDVSTTAYSKLDLEATQEDRGPTGNVTLKGLVDTVRPAWEIVSTDALLDANGDVIDRGTSRVLIGLSVGFDCAVTGATDLEVDDFTHETPSSLIASPDSYAGYTLPAEDAGKTGRLEDNLVPGWNLVRRRLRPVEVGKTYTPVQTAFMYDTFPRRYYDATLAGASDADVAALLTFFDDHKGGLPFDFGVSKYIADDPDGVFRFFGPRIRVTYGEAGARTFAFTLEECVTS